MIWRYIFKSQSCFGDNKNIDKIVSKCEIIEDIGVKVKNVITKLENE